MGWFKKVTKALNPAKAIKSAIKSQGEIVQTALQATTGVVKQAGGTLKAATGVLAENPLLASAIGGAVGIPGLGGMFSGGAPSGGGGGEYAAPASAAAFTPAAASPSIPVWVWIAGGGAALVGLFLVMRRKG